MRLRKIFRSRRHLRFGENRLGKTPRGVLLSLDLIFPKSTCSLCVPPLFRRKSAPKNTPGGGGVLAVCYLVLLVLYLVPGI